MTELITSVKSFIVEALDLSLTKLCFLYFTLLRNKLERLLQLSPKFDGQHRTSVTRWLEKDYLLFWKVAKTVAVTKNAKSIYIKA
jgi:hypothetical protein